MCATSQHPVQIFGRFSESIKVARGANEDTMKARNKIGSKDSTNLRFVQDFHNFCASSLKLSL